MSEETIRALPWFSGLTTHDKSELLRFDRYLTVLAQPEQPASVYGEVLYEDSERGE